MASEPKFHDRVMAVSTTVGAGTYTLGATVRGYQPFSVVGNGNSTFYAAYDCDGAGNPISGDWETGIGTYTSAGTLLSRDSIIESSNANAAVVWGAGTRRIFCPPVSALFSGAADGAVFRRSGTTFGMGALNLATAGATTGRLPGTKMDLSTADAGAGVLPGINGGGLVLLARTVVGAGNPTSVDFSGISGAFENLFIAWLCQDAGAGTGATNLRLKLNNDGTAGNYTNASRIGTQNATATAGPSIASNALGMCLGDIAQVGNTNIPSQGWIRINGYARSVFHKMALAASWCDSTGFLDIYHFASRWKNTAPVTRATLGTDGTGYVAGSVFSVYGEG